MPLRFYKGQWIRSHRILIEIVLKGQFTYNQSSPASLQIKKNRKGNFGLIILTKLFAPNTKFREVC